MTSEVVDSENPDPVVGTSKQRLLDLLGPGLITGAADDDPSGIATYSQPVPGLCRFSFPAPPWRSTVEPNRELCLPSSTTSNLGGTNLGTAGSLSAAATFPDHLDLCTRHPSVIHDRSPFY
jgi:hypothetical protein